MSIIIFYEKPGCVNNRKQKHILIAAGYDLVERNILTETWNPKELRKYFGDLPVNRWFNNSAPAIKNSEMITTELSEVEAISLMLKDPLLIRRPLMRMNETYRVGFDEIILREFIGISQSKQYLDIVHDDNTCPIATP